jgi:hypothetical protein
MAPSTESPTVCPPHHWLVTEEPGASQQWTCLRCGVVHTVDLDAPTGPAADGPPRWGARHR